MNLDRYQRLADKTSGAGGEQTVDRLLCAALGAAGETGELANKVKKWVYHLHAGMPRQIREEVGDTLWYLAEICNAFDWSMARVAEENLQKLADRYPDGFTIEDSINRRE
jgi:NTP pyrophosphatase (non-canonical NTP hydrolase)